MKNNLISTTLFIICLAVFSANAQTPSLVPQDDVESWNDVQLTVPLSAKIDFWNSVSIRFGKNISRLQDARYGIGFIFHPNKHWSFQPFYLSIKARDSRGRFRHENRLSFRATYKFPFKKVGLTHRSLYEYRSRTTGNVWQYRPSITVDKEIKFIPKAKIYVTEEVFYFSNLKKFARNRFTVGISKTLTKKLTLDIFYTRQNDGFARPGDIHAIGASWKIKL
jgi:Protein of unknown function (DUF2490)